MYIVNFAFNKESYYYYYYKSTIGLITQHVAGVQLQQVFTCIGALGTPSRTGPLARKYLLRFPYS